MEWREPVEAETLSKREQHRLDIVNKFHSIREDPGSRAFGFSHGNLILKSIWLSIIGNFLFYGLVISSGFVIVGLFKKPSHGASIAFLHFHISQFAAQWVLYLAGVAALEVASILFGFSGRKRLIWIGTFILLVFVAPTLFLHWSFWGN